MTTPNSQLSSILSALNNQMSKDGYPSYYTSLSQAINTSPALLNELNLAASNGDLTSISFNVSGTGANFQPNSKATGGQINLTLEFLESLPTSSEGETGSLGVAIAESGVIFNLAHEAQHSLNNASFNGQSSGVAAQGQNIETNEASSISSSGLSTVDITSAVNQYVTIHNDDEGSANIQGWNAVVSAAGSLNSDQLKSLQIQSSDQFTLFNADGSLRAGLSQNSDGTISETPSNIAAAGSAVGTFNPSTSLDFISYNQFYAASIVGYELSQAPNKTLELNPSQGNFFTAPGNSVLSTGQLVEWMMISDPSAFIPSQNAHYTITSSDGTSAVISSTAGSSIVTLTVQTPDLTLAPPNDPGPLSPIPNPVGFSPDTGNSPIEVKTSNTSSGSTETGYDYFYRSNIGVASGTNDYTINGENDIITLGSGVNMTIEGDQGDQISSSSSTIHATPATEFSISGGSNGISVSSGDIISVNNQSANPSSEVDAFTGGGATIDEVGASWITAAGGNDTINLQGSGGYVGLRGGTGYNVSATNDVVGFSAVASSTANVSGGNDNIAFYGANSTADLISGSNYTMGGGSGGDTVVANSMALTGQANALFNLTGGLDTVSVASGTNVTVNNAGSNSSSEVDAFTGSGATLNEVGESWMTAAGGNDTINLEGSGGYVGLRGGTGYNVAAENGVVGFSAVASSTANISGGNDNIAFFGANSTADVVSGNNYTVGGGTGGDFVSANGTDFSSEAGVNFGMKGANDILEMASTGTVSLVDSEYHGKGLDNVVATGGNADIVDLGGGGEVTLIGDGGKFNITGNDSTGYIQTSVSAISGTQGLRNDVVYSNGELFNASSSEQLTVIGDNDTITGGTGDDFAIYGYDDSVRANDSTADFYGNDYTGDNISGTGDDGSDDGSGDDGGGYGGYYGYALTGTSTSKTSGTNIGSIAANDIAMNNRTGAIGAETARLQANAAVSSTASGAVFEGPKWSTSTITWSLASDLGSADVPFTGSVGEQYEQTIEQAFQQWAASSGLKFEEVSDSTQADIRIGFSSFDPQDSGVLGYTALKAKDGVIHPDSFIALENPAEDGLSADANGQLAYSGTNTELSQLVLHEIGHALGLADDSDVNSIMYPTLSASNLTLDSTDVAGIQSLYSTSSSKMVAALSSAGGASALSGFSSSAAQLVDAMATFTPTPMDASMTPSLTALLAASTSTPSTTVLVPAAH